MAFAVHHLGSLAESRVATDFIHHFLPLLELDLHLIQIRRLRRPQLRIGDRQADRLAGFDGSERDGRCLAGILRGITHTALAEPDLHAVVLRNAVGIDGHIHGSRIDIRHSQVGGDGRTAHGFHPHALPDTRHRRIPDAIGFGHLLSARLFAVVGGIQDLHGEFLLAPALQERRDIEGKGGIAAGVVAHELVIDIDLGRPVHRFEVQHHALFPPGGRDLERGGIPEGLVRSNPHAHTGERRFDAERDQDLPVPLLRFRVLGRNHGIVPQTIEGGPLFPHHLRTRILRMGVRRGNLGSPVGLDGNRGRLPGLGRGFLPAAHDGGCEQDGGKRMSHTVRIWISTAA